jgi:hypothetical protein
VGLHPAADKRADGAHGHDGAPLALRNHLVFRRLRRVESAVIVDLVGAPHNVGRHVKERVERANAGVAYQHIERAECVHGDRDDTLAGLRFGHVALGGRSPAPKGADLFHDFGDRPRQVVDHNISPLAGATERNGAPDPARRSGDDDHLAFEQHRHLLLY